MGTVEEKGPTTFEEDVRFEGAVEVFGEVKRIENQTLATQQNLVELGNGDAAPFFGIKAATETGDQFLVYVPKEEGWFVVDPGSETKVALASRPPPVSDTHNFWIANKVLTTKDKKREVLPEFVSCLDHENKSITGVHARLSSGSAKIEVTKNGESTGLEVVASPSGSSSGNVGLEDGDLIGIEVLKSDAARNLSLSVVVKTKFDI